MPSRNYSTDKYRYGFNGKEKDKDINSLTAYDYGFRIYNTAIGKFLSVDPLTKNYPSWSPYPFAMNRPIEAVDLDGLEAVSSKVAYIRISLGFNPELKKLTNIEIFAYVSYENTPNWIANWKNR